MRLLKLRVVFKDSPHPWTFDNVSNMCTEGGMLRLTISRSGNKWLPLCNIFSVDEVGREEIERAETEGEP